MTGCRGQGGKGRVEGVGCRVEEKEPEIKQA